MTAAIQRRLEIPEPKNAERTELHPELNRAHVRFINLVKPIKVDKARSPPCTASTWRSSAVKYSASLAAAAPASRR